MNGNDAIEIWHFGGLVDVYGVVGTDGVMTAWDYTNGWAYRNWSSPASTFDPSEWTFSGYNAVAGCTTNDSCSSKFPVKTFGPPTSSPTSVPT